MGYHIFLTTVLRARAELRYHKEQILMNKRTNLLWLKPHLH